MPVARDSCSSSRENGSEKRHRGDVLAIRAVEVGVSGRFYPEPGTRKFICLGEFLQRKTVPEQDLRRYTGISYV